MIDSIIFDLDGTLWDTSNTCAQAWNSVLEREEISHPRITGDQVRSVTGLTHDQCIRKVFKNLDPAQIESLIEQTAEEDNRLIQDLGGDLYPHVPSTLFELSANFQLFIVSNCQEGYIETFLDFTDFGPLIKDFECWGNTRRPKAENIQAVIERNSLRNPIYVGDTQTDCEAAGQCDIPFIFADYGFGNLTKGFPTIKSFNEITPLLSSLKKPLQRRSLSPRL